MVGSESFPITEEGIDRLLTFLLGIELTIDRIGVEGSGFLGRPLVLALTAAGYDVREVQANRTAERRKRRRRAKTDIEDAEAIARETLADPPLPPAGKHATPSPAWQTLTVLRDWRLPGPATRPVAHRGRGRARHPARRGPRRAARDQPRATSAHRARRRPRPARRARPGRPAQARPARDQPARHHDTNETDQRTRPTDSRPTRRARIHPHRPPRGWCRAGGGPSRRDRRPAPVHQRSTIRPWCGIAPVAVSSGEGHGPARRHRLDLGGNRAVNSILHIIHVTQA